MGNAFLHGSSGGTSLNFKIIPYTTEEALLAATPAENTIGIITDTKITSWIFAVSEPSEPAEGMLWIKTGDSSPVAFNALKKNGIMICPISAMQYVSGAWVSVTAKSYVGGSWVNWITYLYNNGDTCDDVTGGWVGYSKKTSSGLGTAVTPTITYEADHVVFAATSTSYPAAMFCTKEKIDLSNRTMLYFDGFVTTKTVYLSVWTDIGDYVTSNQVLAATIDVGDRAVTGVDVSALEGSYYVGFQLKGNETKPSATMYALWAE